jgi:hypothetical protein
MLWPLCQLSGILTLVPSCFGNTAHVNRETVCLVLTSSPPGGGGCRWCKSGDETVSCSGEFWLHTGTPAFLFQTWAVTVLPVGGGADMYFWSWPETGPCSRVRRTFKNCEVSLLNAFNDLHTNLCVAGYLGVLLSKGCGMAQAVQPWVRPRASPCGIDGEENGAVTYFTLSTLIIFWCCSPMRYSHLPPTVVK